VTNYFEVDGAEEYAHHIRTLPAAKKLYNELLHHLEDTKKNDVHISIVGGGYTGIELAGQLADIAEHVVPKLYPNKTLHVSLFNQSDILSRMPERFQKLAKKQLEKQDITMYKNTAVSKVTKNAVFVDAKKHTSDITVWTAGFRNIGDDIMGKRMCTRGQIHINNLLQHPSYDTLYAIGDIACLHDTDDMPLPQLAQVAHLQGIFLGKELAKRLKNKSSQNVFRYSSHGTLMPIGDWYGIAMFGNIIFGGRLVWLMRRVAYLMFLPGIKRKMQTALDWILQNFASRRAQHVATEKNHSTVEIEN